MRQGLGMVWAHFPHTKILCRYLCRPPNNRLNRMLRNNRAMRRESEQTRMDTAFNANHADYCEIGL